jgi:double-stranded uracil-DNA glycosylase
VSTRSTVRPERSAPEAREVEGRHAEGIPDILAPDLRLLFVGINPSVRSAELGHHFSGRGNPFWRLLHAARLTPALLPPDEDRSLLALGMGITNLCARPTVSADELTPAERRAGAELLRANIAEYRPAVVVFVGITAARLVLPPGARADAGPSDARLAGARVFVVPNPSGRNAAFPGFEHKLVWFRRLARFVGSS